MNSYILDERGLAIPCDNIYVWGEFMENGRVKYHKLDEVAGLRISTVFLGIDHNFNPGGEPLLWETMVFDDENATHESFTDVKGERHQYISTPDLIQGRFTFMDDAYAYHNGLVDGYRAKLKDAEIKPNLKTD